LLGDAALQLFGCHFDRLLIRSEFEPQAVAFDGDAQPGGPRRQAERGPQRFLAQFVEAPVNPKQNAPPLVGDQSGW
jgi:hypothetical protein